MPIDPQMIMMGLQLAGGLLGGNEDSEPIAGSEGKSGFAALPPEFQQAYLNAYLPGALNLYNNGNYATPMGRANNDPFASKGLQELQAFSDRQRMGNQSGPALNNPANNTQANAAFGGFNPVRASRPNTPSLGVASAIENVINNQLLPQLARNFNGGNMGNMGGMGLGPMSGLGMGLGPMPGIGMSGLGMGLGGAAGGMAGGLSSGNPTSGLTNNGGLFPNMEGVRPMTVEPLNDFQKNAMTGMANQPSMDPYSQQALGGLSNLTNGISGFNNNMFDPQFIQNRMQSFMNPYQNQVIDATLNRMREQVLGGTNSILGNTARLGGLGAFGSSALGTRLANMENEALTRTQDFLAQSNAANYDQAQKAFFNSIPLQQQGFNQHQTALTNLFNGGGAALEQRRMTLQDMMSAGNQLQKQHQSELNEVSPYITANLPQNKLSQLGNFLSALPNSAVSAPQMQAGGPNMFSKIGGGATFAQGQMQPGGALQSFMPFNQKNELSGGRPWIYD